MKFNQNSFAMAVWFSSNGLDQWSHRTLGPVCGWVTVCR